MRFYSTYKKSSSWCEIFKCSQKQMRLRNLFYTYRTALTPKIVLNLVLAALFLPIKLSSNIKFNTNLTVHVILQNVIWRFSTIQNVFKHLNLKVVFQEWKQHLKIPSFVEYLWKMGTLGSQYLGSCVVSFKFSFSIGGTLMKKVFSRSYGNTPWHFVGWS